jgi:membrane protein
MDKLDSPRDLTKPSWRYTATKAWTEFGRDQCTDLAAALTYYSVLALFPALLALVSLLGVFGQGESTTSSMLDLLRQVGASGAADQLRGPIHSMTQSKGAGLGLVLGVLGALWSASGYVGAFGRAMNRVYQVEEGRPFWKLRPQQVLITIAAVILAALVLVGLVVSGPVARTIGDTIGLGSTAVLVWNIAKWPVILLVVVVLVALLYYATPNVKQPKFRWVSLGAVIAILAWVLASVLFGFYVSNFSHYNKTYGSLAGVIVFLLWLWITNLALLFGAEVDSELERSRELQSGLQAEETLLLPPRDTRASDKREDKLRARIEEGRELRESSVRDPDHASAGAPEDR